jgi:uncharacterized membrane protein
MTTKKRSESVIKKLEKNPTFNKAETEVKKVIHMEQLFLRKLKRKHKFVFAILVFFGVVLLWAGAWKLINMIPYLREPFASIGAGIIILLALGYFYENIL